MNLGNVLLKRKTVLNNNNTSAYNCFTKMHRSGNFYPRINEKQQFFKHVYFLNNLKHILYYSFLGCEIRFGLIYYKKTCYNSLWAI